MARFFDPTVGFARNTSNAIEALELATALIDYIEDIRVWSPKSADFIEDTLARLAVSTKNVHVSDKQLSWLKKLYKQYTGECDE